MSFIVFGLWVFAHSLLLNIGIKAGWGYDPGYVGPMIIVLIFNLTIALYLSAKR